MEQRTGIYGSYGTTLPIGLTTRWLSVPFGVGIAALGMLTFIYATPVAGLEPIPTSLPGHLVLSYISAAVLTAAGVAVTAGLVPRAATAIATVLLVWLVTLLLPLLALHPRSGSEWTVVFEAIALFGAACVLASETPRTGPAAPGILTGRSLGLLCFGCSVLVFGALHLVYGAFVATLIPAWLPWHTFWAYGTGVAFLAAATAILTRVQARLAALLLGLMFGIWVLIVHAPRVALHATDRAEWTSLLIALSMCGASWIVASATRVRDE